jgi:hypothetical protein
MRRTTRCARGHPRPDNYARPLHDGSGDTGKTATTEHRYGQIVGGAEIDRAFEQGDRRCRPVRPVPPTRCARADIRLAVQECAGLSSAETLRKVRGKKRHFRPPNTNRCFTVNNWRPALTGLQHQDPPTAEKGGTRDASDNSCSSRPGCRDIRHRPRDGTSDAPLSMMPPTNAVAFVGGDVLCPFCAAR